MSSPRTISSPSTPALGIGYKSTIGKGRANNAPTWDENMAKDPITQYISQRRLEEPKTLNGGYDWELIAKEVNVKFAGGTYFKPMNAESCKWRWYKYGIHSLVVQGKAVPASWLTNYTSRGVPTRDAKTRELVRTLHEVQAVPAQLVWNCREWLEECFTTKTGKTWKWKKKSVVGMDKGGKGNDEPKKPECEGQEEEWEGFSDEEKDDVEAMGSWKSWDAEGIEEEEDGKYLGPEDLNNPNIDFWGAVGDSQRAEEKLSSDLLIAWTERDELRERLRLLRQSVLDEVPREYHARLEGL